MSLRERHDIVDLCSDAAPRGAGVLFSVVRVQGSSYRQPGARMVQLADGRTAGTLSGGCLESELLRRAAWTVRNGAVAEHFSTAFDDTAEVPYGLGCGGEIDVLMEPLETPEATALLESMAATLHGEERSVATLLERGAGLRRTVLDGRGDVLFASKALQTDEIVAVRGAVLDSHGCRWLETRSGWLFVEQLRPVQRLVIFGGGEDARPLARLAGELGWQAVVVDTRGDRLQPARFPGARCVLADSAAAVPVGEEDAVVLMTHSYVQDRSLLAELLGSRVRYLGLLGARHRSALLLSEAAAAAGVSLERALECTHAPIGLDLGGEGPEAVALAIVAEVQQVLAHRHGRAARRLNVDEATELLDQGCASSYTQCSLGETPAEAVAL